MTNDNLLTEIRRIFNTVDHKWTKYYDDNPLSSLNPDYDNIVGEDELEEVLPTPTPNQHEGASLADLIAIMNGVK